MATSVLPRFQFFEQLSITTLQQFRDNFWSATRRLSVRQKFSPGQRENLQDRQILVSSDNNLGLENIILVFRWYCFSAFLPKNVKAKAIKILKNEEKKNICY